MRKSFTLFPVARPSLARLPFTLLSVTVLTLLSLAPPASAQLNSPALSSALPTPARAVARDMRSGMILRGRSRHRIIHFTFDDGPRLETTPTLLSHLDDAGVRATFFLVARQLDGDRGRRGRQVALARRMMRQGHTIGLHGFDHTALTDLGEDEIVAQLDRSELVFQERLGYRPWLFRPPYGRHDEKSDEVLSGRGYTQVMWTITAERRNATEAVEVAENFERAIARRESSRSPGGIVILHDRHQHVVDAFPMMIERIRARNCELLRTGDELWDIENDPRLFFVPRGEESASDYAPAVRLSIEELETRQHALRRSARAHCEPA